METLPPFSAIADLPAVLAVLFEHSQALSDVLTPQLTPLLAAIDDYHQLIDTSIALIKAWSIDQRALFIAAHPRIGETKAALSALSASEQQRHATPPEVLIRLEELNKRYERMYPGLVYITFVNGRSRAKIADEMALKLRDVVLVERGSDEWIAELDRAVEDVGRIAHSRLKALGVD